jgi:hypothetical protein
VAGVLVDDLRACREPQLARATQPQAPLVVVAPDEEVRSRRVGGPGDVAAHEDPDEGRVTALRAVDVLGGPEVPHAAVDLAAGAQLERAVRVDDLLAQRGGAGVARPRALQQAFQRVGTGLGVVVHHPQPVAAVARPLDRRREAAGRAAVLGQALELHARIVEQPAPAQQLARAVRGRVVHDHDALERARLGQQRVQALGHQRAAVVRDDGGADAHRRQSRETAASRPDATRRSYACSACAVTWSMFRYW